MSEPIRSPESTKGTGGVDDSLGPLAQPAVGAVFWAAVCLGLALTLLGITLLSRGWIAATPALLVMCSGLGIMFGGFGSTATLRYKGYVITGVGAVAIGLLLVVNRLITDEYVELEIGGDVKEARIELVGERSFPGAQEHGRHRFFIIGSGMHRKFLEATISFDPDEEGAGEREYTFECIPKSEFERYLGSGQLVEWVFDAQAAQLHLSDSAVIEMGRCREV